MRKAHYLYPCRMPGDPLRRDALDEIVVDQDRRGEAARAETLDLDDGEAPIGAGRPELAASGVLAETPCATSSAPQMLQGEVVQTWMKWRPTGWVWYMV